MAAQRAEDFSPVETERIQRRMWMVMAAAGVFEKKDLAVVLDVSASTAGRWLNHPDWAILYRFAKALKGRGDVTGNFTELRDFLELRGDAFPWASAEADNQTGTEGTTKPYAIQEADVIPIIRQGRSALQATG